MKKKTTLGWKIDWKFIIPCLVAVGLIFYFWLAPMCSQDNCGLSESQAVDVLFIIFGALFFLAYGVPTLYFAFRFRKLTLNKYVFKAALWSLFSAALIDIGLISLGFLIDTLACMEGCEIGVPMTMGILVGITSVVTFGFFLVLLIPFLFALRAIHYGLKKVL
jgi:hypothetical protein